MGPQTVGMLMIAIGLVSLVFANLYHRRGMRALRAECPGLAPSVAGPTGVVVMALGVVAFVGALL